MMTKIVYSFAVVVAVVLVSFTVLFFYSYAETPHTSELVFVETSSISNVVGSIVPASCESAPPTNHGIPGHCPVPPAPAYLTASCNTQGTSVRISWPAPAWATHYAVRFSEAAAGAPLMVFNNDLYQTWFDVVVSPNVNYVAWVHSRLVIDGVNTSSPTFTEVRFSCPAPAIGSFDSVDQNTCSVRGWAFDPDISSAEITVQVYQGNSAFSGGTFVTACNANQVNPLVNTAYGISGNHGFNCPLPGSFYGQPSQSLYIHAIDLSSTPNNVIGGSPRSLQCPTGSLNAVGCVIPDYATTCPANVDWASNGFVGGTEVLKDGSVFSTTPSNATTANIGSGSTVFILRDLGSSFSMTRIVSALCTGTSVSTPVGCLPLPIISILATPNIIRSGDSAPIRVEITANYRVQCDLRGGISVPPIIHNPSASMVPYNVFSDILTAGQVVEVECFSIDYPAVRDSDSTKVEVTASFQET